MSIATSRSSRRSSHTSSRSSRAWAPPGAETTRSGSTEPDRIWLSRAELGYPGRSWLKESIKPASPASSSCWILTVPRTKGSPWRRLRALSVCCDRVCEVPARTFNAVLPAVAHVETLAFWRPRRREIVGRRARRRASNAEHRAVGTREGLPRLQDPFLIRRRRCRRAHPQCRLAQRGVDRRLARTSRRPGGSEPSSSTTWRAGEPGLAPKRRPPVGPRGSDSRPACAPVGPTPLRRRRCCRRGRPPTPFGCDKSVAEHADEAPMRFCMTKVCPSARQERDTPESGPPVWQDRGSWANTGVAAMRL